MRLEVTWEGVPRHTVSVRQQPRPSRRYPAEESWEVRVTLDCGHIYLFDEPSMVEVPEPFLCLDCMSLKKAGH